MSRQGAIATYRVVFALLALAAVATQFTDLATRGVLDPLHFFSYFTIQSNLIAAVVLLVMAANRGQATSRGMDVVRGGAVVYMTVTGVVFSVLLANTNVDTAIPWVNDVVHELMPIVMVADWLLDPPRRILSVGDSLRWLTYPAVWLVYTLVKGPVVGKYPYPFLDPANGGYGSVALYSTAILIGLLIVCLAARWVANAAASRTPAAARTSA